MYSYDTMMFNCTLALPSTNKLRSITSKLGQFLDLDIIETLSLNVITSKFIIDFNLPCTNLFSYLLNLKASFLFSEIPIEFSKLRSKHHRLYHRD